MDHFFLFYFWLFRRFVNPFLRNLYLRQSVSVVSMVHYGIRSLLCLLKYSPDKVRVYLSYWPLPSLSTTLYSHQLTCLGSDVWAYFKKISRRVKWSIFIRTSEGCNTFELQTWKENNYVVSWRIRRITAPNGSIRHCFSHLPGLISFLAKNLAVGMIVGTSGLGMIGLHGSFKFTDAHDSLQKWILVLSPSKVSQFWIDGTNLYSWNWHEEMWTLVLNLSASSFIKKSSDH